MIHVDIWGGYKVASISGARYFLTIVDDFTRCTWIFLMRHKSDTQTHLLNFINMIETQFSCKIKIVRSDNGPEFTLKSFYSSKGIIHQTSCVHTPQQNGVVERKHRHLLNMARALLFQAHLPQKFWGDAILTAAYLINRTPTPVLKNKSPFEKLFNKIPTYSHLRVFGCLCFASTHAQNPSKFDARSTRCIFLGYPYGIKGYRVYDLEQHKIFVSRDVTFFENEFPFEHIPTSNESLMLPIPTTSTIDDDEQIQCPALPEIDATIPIEQHEPLPTIETTPENSTPPPTHRKSNRPTKPPSFLQDFHIEANLPSRPAPSSSSSVATISGISYPLSDVLSYDRLSTSHKVFATSLSIVKEPTSFLQAMEDPKWREAMHNEIQALQANSTWTLTALPPGKKPIGCRWVYKVKLKSDGTIERYKARLVAKGYNQIEGLDYTETFAPVAKLVTVRVLLSVAAIQGWHLHQLDVNNAFLHGDLDEAVYMALPPGFGRKGETRVCKLNKSLYGLKQASRQWYLKLSSALKAAGFQQSKADYSLFVRSHKGSFTAILVYVDDVILAGNNLQYIEETKQFLAKQFKLKDLGQLKYFLGIEVARSSTDISL